MLSDPIGLTYDATAKSLPRTAPKSRGVVKILSQSGFNTSDGEFDISIKHYQLPKNALRVEFLLTRTAPDPDGPFVGTYPDTSNSVGLIFHTNSLRVNASVDIPKLKTALLALVDTTFESRLIAGEG